MLIGHGEKPLIVRLLPFSVLLGYAGGHGIDALQLLLAFVQGIIINIFCWPDDQIQRRLVQDRKQIAGDPVGAHANRNKGSQGQRDQNGNAVCHPLLTLALLLLQRIQLILPHTQHPRCGTRGCRHQQAGPTDLAGDLCVNGCRIVAQHGLHSRNDAHKQHQLDDHGNSTGNGMVFFLLIELLSLLGNGVLIPVIPDFQRVEIRCQLHHFDAFALHPAADRKQDDLCQQREKDDSRQVAACPVVAQRHQGVERDRNVLHSKSSVVHSLAVPFVLHYVEYEKSMLFCRSIIGFYFADSTDHLIHSVLSENDLVVSSPSAISGNTNRIVRTSSCWRITSTGTSNSMPVLFCDLSTVPLYFS